MLTGAGNTMFDLGRDVPIKNIIDKAKAEGADIVAPGAAMPTPSAAAAWSPAPTRRTPSART